MAVRRPQAASVHRPHSGRPRREASQGQLDPVGPGLADWHYGRSPECPKSPEQAKTKNQTRTKSIITILYHVRLRVIFRVILGFCSRSDFGAYQFMNLVQESWYLKPYLDEIEAEKKQRVESSGNLYFYYLLFFYLIVFFYET